MWCAVCERERRHVTSARPHMRSLSSRAQAPPMRFPKKESASSRRRRDNRGRTRKEHVLVATSEGDEPEGDDEAI